MGKLYKYHRHIEKHSTSFPKAMFIKQYGIVPEKEFLERSIMLNIFNLHSFLGIKPLKLLPPNKRLFKFGSPSVSSGMLPKMLLSLMSNVRRYDELRMAFGSDPVSLFPCKSRCKIFYKFKQDGNNPESKFRERSIIENALTPHGI